MKFKINIIALLATSIFSTAAVPSKPNFMIIFTDDQGYQALGYHDVVGKTSRR